VHEQPPERPSAVRAASGDGAGALDGRIAGLAADLRGRLALVCRDWDEADFEALVQQMARTKARWTDAGFGE
jgi:hypothetical protein